MILTSSWVAVAAGVGGSGGGGGNCILAWLEVLCNLLPPTAVDLWPDDGSAGVLLPSGSCWDDGVDDCTIFAVEVLDGPFEGNYKKHQGDLTLELSSCVLEIQNDDYTTRGQNLIGRSTVSWLDEIGKLPEGNFERINAW